MPDRTMLQPFENAIVLIVEDNEMSVGLLRATLSRAGLVAVHAVTDSEIAIEAVKGAADQPAPAATVASRA